MGGQLRQGFFFHSFSAPVYSYLRAFQAQYCCNRLGLLGPTYLPTDLAAPSCTGLRRLALVFITCHFNQTVVTQTTFLFPLYHPRYERPPTSNPMNISHLRQGIIIIIRNIWRKICLHWFLAPVLHYARSACFSATGRCCPSCTSWAILCSELAGTWVAWISADRRSLHHATGRPSFPMSTFPCTLDLYHPYPACKTAAQLQLAAWRNLAPLVLTPHARMWWGLDFTL